MVKIKRGARPRTIPKNEKERQERMSLMEETHKQALFNYYFKGIKEPVIISKKEYDKLFDIEDFEKVIEEDKIKFKTIGGVKEFILVEDIKRYIKELKEKKKNE